jgi:succinate dehydrogenase / fumarate reductase membrane anchor subunit
VSRPTHGLRDWLLQRLSAVYLAAFLLYLMVHFSTRPQYTYPQWHDWVTQPLVLIAGALFILALLIHGWVGMRDVVLDYVRSLQLRLLVLSLVALILTGCGLWAFQVLLRTAG